TALAVAVLRVLAEMAPALRRPDLVLLDAWQSLRGTANPSPQVVIVGIDQKSIGVKGAPAWPRNEYVPLIEKLSKAGARMIAFDVTFGTVEREAPNNPLFAAAMKQAGNVVFGYEFTGLGNPSPPGMPAPEEIQASAFPRFKTAAPPPASGVIAPEPVLAEAAAGIGHVATVESEDGRIRVLLLVVRHGDKAYPSLALQMARVYTGTPSAGVEALEGRVAMGEWDIPVSDSGEVLLDWPAAGEKAFPEYSFLDVVRGDIADEAFRGKAVLVAFTADGLDDRDFPFAVEAPGVLVYATFLDNLFRADFVQAPRWAWLLEWGLFLAAAGAAVWLMPRLTTPMLLAGVPAAALAVLGTAAFLFVQQGLWIKVLYPCVALVAPLATAVAFRLRATERESHDLAAEKVENQRLLGLSFQEKGMLDMALATFNKLPFTEDMKLVYVNLGVDYENRGQRDKALLAYHKVFEKDPGFEDVGHRIQRLTQAGPSTPTLVPTASPTAVPGASPGATLKPPTLPATLVVPTGDESPLAALVSTPDTALPHEAPTLGVPTGPTLSGGGLTSQPTPLRPPSPFATPTPLGMRTPLPTSGTLSGSSFAPGTRFARFEIEKHLGRGGMGDVYLVRDTVMQRRAALKTIRPSEDLSPQELIEMRQRFYREAQTAGRLTHPNIVTVYDVGEELGMSYIVMEFVEGQTLTRLMKKDRLSAEQVRHVIYNAGMGLDYAHANGVFHRDVKPDNIMVTSGGLVKVMDFGIARVVESSLTRTGSVIGTPAYMSPEQVNGQKIDARSDVFSLGVILYELLAGRKPFKGETVPALMFAIIKAEPDLPSTLDPKVDPAWDPIVRKALAKERDERYASARELAEAVRDAPAR
ncbi:MAG TPA: CHASE2 domain-containing protein, partial [Vicinamibacteria bacterium]|nr:CHASE2 domain-containing protein [Vicinamibacteria bacterium]